MSSPCWGEHQRYENEATAAQGGGTGQRTPSRVTGGRVSFERGGSCHFGAEIVCRGGI